MSSAKKISSVTAITDAILTLAMIDYNFQSCLFEQT